MDFDTVTVARLLLGPNAAELTEAEEDLLQDAHLAHLAAMHHDGELLAAGPVLGAEDRDLRGFSVYRSTDIDHVRAIADDDPAIQVGRMRHEFHVWTFPAGLVTFSHGRMPRSMADVLGA
ncbi:MAG TPA: YciI family protein [Actinomycetes bacterium]|nr:YciI family protein [Actinomycetes bacterium]